MIYKFLKFVVLGVGLFLAGQNSAFAVKISGKITDAKNGNPLVGATVMITVQNIGSLSDANGNYLLTGVPSGEHILEISYLGYQPVAITVNVIEGTPLVKNISLEPSLNELTGVDIVSRAEGQVKAFAEQRDAENIVNVVSAQMIQSFPDLNAADALQRVAGVSLQRDQGEGRYVQLRGTPPEFTNFNINGIQLPSPESEIRTVGMDIVNASQIQTIQVAKVITPDMNADAIGGSVNLITKRAESYEPEIKALMAGGFNNLRQSPNGELQFTYSQRKGRFGFLLNSNMNYTHQGADNIEFKYEKGVFFGDEGPDNYHIQYNEVQLRHYDLKRTRTGLSATLDYYLDENNVVYVTGMYNHYKDDEIRRRKVYTLDDALSERSYLYGGIEHDLRDRIEEQLLSVINIGAEHTFGSVKLDYEVSWAEAIQRQNNGMEVTFDNPGQAIFIQFDRADPEYPKATFPDPDNAGQATDYDNYELEDLLFTNELSEDINVTGKLNLKLPYTINENHKGYFKVGTLIRGKNKYRDVRATSYAAYSTTSRIYPLPGDTLSLLRVAGDFKDDNLLDKGYEMEAMPDPDKMRDFYEEFQNLFIYGSSGITETRERTFGEDYLASENVYTGYAMFRHDYKKLMILGGLRYEQTDIIYQGYRINKRSSGYITGIDTIDDSRRQAFFLPNFQLKYTPAPGVNYRAAITYSYARPNFRDVIPYRVQSERSEVRFGNPDIDYPLAMNIDLLAEKYWRGRNMISGGLFYKEIQDFIFNYRIFGFEGDPREANLSRVQVQIPLNGQRASVRGAEISGNVFFNGLPGHWKNLGVFANYTYTNSTAIINKRLPANDFSNIILFGEDYDELFFENQDERLPLPGQANHTVNFALFYDKQKVYFKVAVNYTDAFLNALGADADLDEYYGANFRVDLNGYYQFNDYIQVFGDVRNVTNEPLRFYLGAPENGRLLQQEFYSFWARLGLRINI